MKTKIVARLAPVFLGLVAGTARADLEPFSFSASEQVQHQSNVNRGSGTAPQGNWLSTTELRAALDQAIGRDRLTGSAAVNYNKYRYNINPDTVGYTAAVGLDWNTVGSLSGTLAADSQRHQYFYGLNGESAAGSGRNLETDNHVGGTVQLGAAGRWVIFAGADASNRNYSNASFAANEQRQWSSNLGTRYQTSPDLSFGMTGSYTKGRYPNAVATDEFSLRSIDATTHWQAGGSTSFDARVGYTSEQVTAQPDQNFANGALSWNWSPPSRFAVSVGLSRDANADTSAGTTITDNSTASLAGRSVNDSAHATVSYELTSKINFVANAQYVRRKYSNSNLAATNAVTGSNRTSVYGLSAHYVPTRTTDLNCGFTREIRTVDASLVTLTPAYTDNTVQCAASIQFK